MIPDQLKHAIEHAHYMGHSIEAVINEYRIVTNTALNRQEVQAFIKTLPPVCRSCSI